MGRGAVTPPDSAHPPSKRRESWPRCGATSGSRTTHPHPARQPRRLQPLRPPTVHTRHTSPDWHPASLAREAATSPASASTPAPRHARARPPTEGPGPRTVAAAFRLCDALTSGQPATEGREPSVSADAPRPAAHQAAHRSRSGGTE
ncbi:hypothetical protein GCM10027440_07210 [Nocardiopsis coralliicola]